MSAPSDYIDIDYLKQDKSKVLYEDLTIDERENLIHIIDVLNKWDKEGKHSLKDEIDFNSSSYNYEMIVFLLCDSAINTLLPDDETEVETDVPLDLQNFNDDEKNLLAGYVITLNEIFSKGLQEELNDPKSEIYVQKIKAVGEKTNIDINYGLN